MPYYAGRCLLLCHLLLPEIVQQAVVVYFCDHQFSHCFLRKEPGAPFDAPGSNALPIFQGGAVAIRRTRPDVSRVQVILAAKRPALPVKLCYLLRDVAVDSSLLNWRRNYCYCM